jgi:hypothetical protein
MEGEAILETLNFISEIETAIVQEYRSLFDLSDAFQRKLADEERHLPYHINVIDELHINENGHSRILCKLLCFANSKGEYEILESLVDYIIRISHLSEFERIEIANPIITQEISRIDLWVRDRDKKYALIFENKIYNATDQDAQLSRYIDKTIADGFKEKDIFVIYLSQSGNKPNPNSWGNYENEFSSRYINLSFYDNILPWLKNDVFPNIREKDVYLKSAINQYIDYLEGLFFLRTIDNIMNMNLDKLISDHFELDKCKNDKERACLLQEKMNELQDLIQKMQSLKNRTRQIIFEEWKRITKDRYPDLHPLEKGYFTDVSFNNISGKKVNVFIHEDAQLYCQVQFDTDLPQEERKVENSKIMTLKDILPEPKKNPNDCVWKYFSKDDYDGVFNLFIEVVERCKKLVD